MKKPLLLMLKAQGSSIPPGAYWITVRPNGEGTPGQPVLVHPQEDGSAKVIGGAGGSLNHLKLRAVKSKSEYKEEAKARQAEARKKKKEQTAADKEAGIYESKKQAKKDLKAQKQEAERGVIEAVAKVAGWKPEDLEFPEEDYAHLSEKALAKVKDRHHRKLLSRAKEVIAQSRERLVSEAALRAEAGIGEVPLMSDDPDHLSVQDLDPIKPPSKGLGFAPDYKGRAKAAGLSDEALAAEETAFKQAKLADMTDAQKEAAFKQGQAHEILKQELEGIQTPAAPTADASLLKAKEALDLVREGKRLSIIEKQAREASSGIDKAKSEPKAFVLEAASDAELDEAVKKSVESDLRTIQTVRFLDEVGKIAGGNPGETLGRHIGVGAYNSINSLSLAVGGQALVDRSVVDVLGVAGAAQVLARRLHTDLSPEELQNVTDGVQDWHMNHYMAASTESLKKARDLMDAAEDIELNPDAKTGIELAEAQELNARRRAAIGDAQKILGQSLGEMEANAALVMALKQGPSKGMEMSLGGVSHVGALQQVRALGLQPGDYHLESIGADTFVSIKPSGLDRLAKEVSRDDIQQVNRNLSIIRGDQDEDGWLPLGVANRPDLAMDVKPGVAERMAQPFEPGDDLQASLKDYIGGRAADGDAPADILSDIQSSDFFGKVGADRTKEYAAALDAVAPLKGEDGKMRPIETFAGAFDKYADDYAAKMGGEISPINRQKFEVNQTSVDALHRALTQTPEGKAAYKQIGELDHKDQSAIREFFHREIAKESPDAEKLRQDLEAHLANEPEKTTTDMFGEEVDSPEWKDWRAHRDNLAEKHGASTLTWSKYVKTMGGNARAYESVQDAIRSKVSADFIAAYNKLNPGAPLKQGKTVMRNNLRHLDAVDPEAREARLKKDKALVDKLRDRIKGKYASGSVSDKIEAAKQEEVAFSQAQMGFFASEEAPSGGDEAPPLGADERHTIGHAAERQIAGMMEHVGANFKPGQKTKLWNISMSGKYVNQQRAIKMLASNKRVGLAFGAGSGKTNIMLGAHAHLSGLGKVKRSLMLVPSVVQGQFHGEAMRLLEPGKFNTHIQPGASREERIAAYKDPDTHIAVMTHQAFRDDMLHLGAKQAGIDEGAMAESLQSMSPDKRREWAAGVMQAEGINFDASFVDEAHETLNRAGKENSALANVVDSFAAHTPYYVYASGDPVKNDASEVHSMLEKLDPERYGNREAFMRRYGADTVGSKEALQREMARYVFPATIGSGVEADRRTEKVDLSDEQKEAIDQLHQHMAKARAARMAGKVDIEAAKALSPRSFEGVPESEHEGIAEKVQQSLGVLKSSGMNRIINTHESNNKVKKAVEMANERKGKQGVVFAKNREAVRQYQEALEAAGHRVVTVTGSDSAADKDTKRQMFNPESGEAQADIMVASDAGATGLNLQSAHYLIQHDIPDTAKTHSQRQARIDRIGQKNKVELVDLHADHPEEKKSHDRLMKKYGLKEMMASPLGGLDDTGVAGAIKARKMSAQPSLL